AYLFYCVTWMLWFINGWSWSNAIPNLSPRSIAAAAGISFLIFYNQSAEETFRLVFANMDIAEAKDFLNQKGVDVGFA
ncbi:hypothetical protein QQP08_001193, partial [Theobroma cacao]